MENTQLPNNWLVKALPVIAFILAIIALVSFEVWYSGPKRQQERERKRAVMENLVQQIEHGGRK